MSKILIAVDEDAWLTLSNTLAMYCESSAFDPGLRKEISEALDTVEEVKPLVLVYVQGGLVQDEIIPDGIDLKVWDYDNWEESQQCPNCGWERFPYIPQTDTEFLEEGPWNRIENGIQVTEGPPSIFPQNWKDLWDEKFGVTEVEEDDEDITHCPECNAPLEEFIDLQKIYDFLTKDQDPPKFELAKDSAVWRLYFPAVKVTGNYTEAIYYIEESLTPQELNELKSFVEWFTEKLLSIGHGNYYEVYRQYLADKSKDDN